ncbi:MAG: citrate/2-methylcitrate synthase, partial [Ilumatobacteraceae bacterium]
MTTYVRSAEAARLLGVSPSTLYAYVSRGRIGRRTAADGRASLFALDEVEALADRSRRGRHPARPTIDVQITSAVTSLSEDGVTVRGHDLPALVSAHPFEDVAELLWTDRLPDEPVRWPTPRAADTELCDRVTALPGLSSIGRLAVAAQTLASTSPEDEPSLAARRLITLAPGLLGSSRVTGRFARRLTHAWRSKPSSQLVDAIDTALGLLADHELATSTLAVRVAASVRTSSYGALAAGLATVEGALHGSASAASHRLLADCAD